MSQQSLQSAGMRQLLEKSALEIKKLRAQVKEVEQKASEPIAIIGMGCRFPGGATTPEEFWRLMEDGVDVITEVPPERWSLDKWYDPDPDTTEQKMYTRWGGFLPNVDQFDPSFFGISPREAVSLDPQQRLLLEVSWEALERAGLTPDKLLASITGVYIGICSHDYETMLTDVRHIDPYTGTGNAHSVASGRISYWLGLKGPSMAVDTACSSSLVTTHLAVQALRAGECNLALASGVGLILAPNNSIYFSRLRAMSPEGRCKTFDASADGYVRSEGCGVVVLKRLSDAQRDGNPILAVIRGTAVNQDGRSQGLTAPNGPSQQTVIRNALEQAGIAPSAVGYVETHGTGTALGDPIEVQALGAVMAEGRPMDRPVILGAVKSNIGHTEGAAGVAGLIKAILVLQNEKIPKTLHFNNPNPHIAWESLPVKVAQTEILWPRGNVSRIVGVSSFGFSGTNAHVVLEEAPADAETISHPTPAPRPRPSAHVITLSAQRPDALAAQAERLRSYVQEHSAIELGDLAYSLSTSRTHFPHRMAWVGETRDQLTSDLASLSGGSTPSAIVRTPADATLPGRSAFLFTGQGSQYVGMGRELYDHHPVYRDALDACAGILLPLLQRPLVEVMFAPEGATDAAFLDQTAYTQPALFALEYALFQLWTSWGVRPEFVLGHSVGELVAACVAGVFSLDDGLKLVAARGRLMQELPEGGAMASVHATEAEVQERIGRYADRVSIGALNGPGQTVISGTESAVMAIAGEFEQLKRKTTRLTVSHAFHSPLIEPMMAEFRRIAESVSYHRARIPVVSNVDGDVAGESLSTAEYWVKHVRAAVRFADGMKTLHGKGVTTYVEIGPRPTLLGMGSECVPSGAAMRWLPSLRKGRNDESVLFKSLAQWYVVGRDLDWKAFAAPSGAHRVPLPTYAFQRQRYWLEEDKPLGELEAQASASGTSDAALWSLVQADRVDDVAQLISPQAALSDRAKAVLPELVGALAAYRSRTQKESVVRQWLYAPVWRFQSLRTSNTVDASGRWLVLMDNCGVGQSIVQSLTAAGGTCVQVFPQSLPENSTASRHGVVSSSREEVHALFCREMAIEGGVRGVICLWGIDDDATKAAPDPTNSSPLLRVLNAVQAMGGAGIEPLPRCWFVTRGAMSVGPSDPVLSPSQAMVWGLGRVVSLERPDIWGGLIDLPAEPEEREIAAIVATVTGSEAEDHQALRPTGRFVQRLTRYTPPTKTSKSWTTQGTVLITGGVGALGLQVARWLAGQGVPHLVLTSRSGLSAKGAAEAAASLEALGTKVTVARADAGDREAMARVITEIAKDGPPLKAVFHAAGREDITPLMELQASRLEEILAAKVHGTQILEELTRDLPLEAFVCFSSIAAVWGSAGQASYAAANAYLDAWTRARRAAGKPALAVNWGPWAGGGMATAEGLETLKRRGVHALPPEDALNALGLLLSADVTHVVVANMDWPRFRAVYETVGVRPLLSEMEGAPAVFVAGPSELVQSLRETPATERRGRLQSWLQGEVGRVLGLGDAANVDPHKGFFDLGMDSLMAVELRNRMQQELGVNVPATVTFNHPHVSGVTDYLLKTLTLGESVAASPATKVAATGPIAIMGEEPIAIVGMGMRLPGGVTDAESLWTLLDGGTDAVGPIPTDRWDTAAWYDPDPEVQGKMYVKEGGFIADPDKFDSQFFGISPREATQLDPQHRLLLETCWEALEHAGVLPGSLRDSRTGIFIGIGPSDYGVLQQKSANAITMDAYTGTGTGMSFSAGRLSYVLGLQGPSMAVDTACSSSLVALHLACQSLRGGECAMAISGGVQLMLSPLGHVYLSRTRALAPDGRCKTFSADADGYGRGEGCGMLVLKRLSDAQAAGDRIWAIIRGTAVNHDGTSSGLTVPNGNSQQIVLRQALTNAGLSPLDVQYVEAHGTGTPLGDPIEVEALATVYGEGRLKDDPLYLGAIKANIGHLESASGVAGVLKIVVALQHEIIPPHLHASKLNPHIRWSELPVMVTQHAIPWPRSEKKRRAAVSAFGMSGTNAHVVLEEAPATIENVPQPASASLATHIVTISAQRSVGLEGQADRLLAYMSEHSGLELADLAHSLATARTHFPHRLAWVGETRDQLTSDLASVSEGKSPSSIVRSPTNATLPGRSAFLFTGQGSQYVGMGRELYDHHSVYRDALDACAGVLMPLLERPLLSVMFAPEGTADAGWLDQTAYTQPALFALEYSLYQLWTSWGVRPEFVLGHSVGELAAACVAGVFTLDDGLKLIAARGRLMQELPEGGAMASIHATEAEVQERIGRYADRVSIGAVNGPAQTVISGTESAVLAIAGEFEQLKRKTTRLTVSHAFHSPLMEPMVEEFRRVAESVSYHRTRIPVVSNVDGEVAGEALSTADYWVKHVRAAVRFSDGMKTLHGKGVTTFVEIGPRPTLLGMGSECLPSGAVASWLPSLRKGRSDAAMLLKSLGQWYVGGREVDWKSFAAFTGGHRILLPTYAFQRQRYWLDVSARPEAPTTALGTNPGRYPLSGVALTLPGEVMHNVVEIGPAHQTYLGDHVVFGRVVVPGAFYLGVVLSVVAERWQLTQATLEEVQFIRPLVLDGEVPLHVVLTPIPGEQGARFSLSTEGKGEGDGTWRTHVEGTVRPGVKPPSLPGTLEAARAEYTTQVSVQAMFEQLKALNINWGPRWRWLTAAQVGGFNSVVRLEAPEGVSALDSPLHPSLIDNSFAGGLASVMAYITAAESTPQLPYAVGSLRWYANAPGPVWAQSIPRARGKAEVSEMTLADLILWDESGQIVAEIEGFASRRAPKDIFLKLGEALAESPLFALTWKPLPPREAAGAPVLKGRWLVLASSHPEADSLRQRIQAAGATANVGVFDSSSHTSTVDASAVNLQDPAEVQQWLTASAASDPVTGVVCWWGRDTATREDPAAAEQTAVAGLHVVQGMQALARSQASPPRLWWVTTGAQPISPDDSAALATAPLWGLGRVWLQECPELRGTMVDMASKTDPNDAAEALAGLLSSQDDENQVAFRAGAWLGARLNKAAPVANKGVPKSESYTLVTRQKGTFDQFELIPAMRRAPGRGEVEIAVAASGLNFRDVVNVLGIAGDLGPLGGECAGVVTAIGPGVTHISVGDRMMALAPASFSRFVTVDARLTIHQPEGISAEQAATIPAAFVTAWIGLYLLAGLKKGQRVLIHAAAGGVGMAAVQLALRAGAEVYATASPSKWDAVRSLGVQHIASSRTLDFAKTFREATGGQGMDLVLNALAGPFTDASLALTAPGGHFLEMGKTDLRTPEAVSRAYPGVIYEPFDLARIMMEQPDSIHEMLTEILAGVNAGELHPLPLRAQPITEAEAIFRAMAQAKHIGKLVLTAPSDAATSLLRPMSTVLITGGLGALGLQLAHWLVKNHGASHMILVGRSPATAERLEAVEALRTLGATVTVAQADAGDRHQLQAVLEDVPKDRPLRGVIHAAGLLDDGTLASLDARRFTNVLDPKVKGGWNLHALTKGMDLDFFILFSSIASLLGSPGQGNYSSANAYLDGLAGYRRSQGLPGISLNWGPWAAGGMAARLTTSDQARLNRQGFGSIEPDQGLAWMQEAMIRPEAQLGILPLDLAAFRRALPPGFVPALFRDLVRPQRTSTSGPSNTELIARLKGLPANERSSAFQEVLQTEVAKVLGLASARDVPLNSPFKDLGLDSLMAVELRNSISALLGRPLQATLLFDYPTLNDMSGYLLRELLGKDAEEPEIPDAQAEKQQAQEAALQEQIKEMSDDDLVKLLEEELAL